MPGKTTLEIPADEQSATARRTAARALRTLGDVHDKCTRNHKRTQIADVVSDVKWHLKRNGPWRYKLSSIYYESEVDAALAELNHVQQLKAA